MMSGTPEQSVAPVDWRTLHSCDTAGSSCHFELADLGLTSVSWNLKLIDSIREDIARAPVAGSQSANLEGLLMGQVEGGQNLARPKPEVHISWFLPLTGSTAEHVSAIENRIEQAKKRNLEVVGVFRTHVNGLEDVNTEDLRLANLFLSQSEHLLLIVRLDDSKPPSAALYFPYGGRNASHFPIVFPFDRRSLVRGENESLSDRAIEQTVPSRLRWFRFPVALAGIAIAVFAYMQLSKPVPESKSKVVAPVERPRPPRPDFRLSGISEKGLVRLTWDRNFAPIASAGLGLLTVEDGTFQNVIRLNRIALQQGSVVYRPLTTEVKFKLQIGSSFGELALATTPAPRINAPVQVQFGVNEGKSVTPLKETANNTTLRPMQNPPVSLEARPGALPAALIPALPPPIEAVSASPANPRLPEVAVPIAAPAAVVTYVAPDSDRRVFPDMPPNIIRLLTAAIVIHVTVQVDGQGTVTAAEPREAGSSIVNYLAQLSKQAALRWHFKPARRDNLNVPSQTVLEFRFSPPQ